MYLSFLIMMIRLRRTSDTREADSEQGMGPKSCILGGAESVFPNKGSRKLRTVLINYMKINHSSVLVRNPKTGLRRKLYATVVLDRNVCFLPSTTIPYFVAINR